MTVVAQTLEDVLGAVERSNGTYLFVDICHLVGGVWRRTNANSAPDLYRVWRAQWDVVSRNNLALAADKRLAIALWETRHLEEPELSQAVQEIIAEWQLAALAGR